MCLAFGADSLDESAGRLRERAEMPAARRSREKEVARALKKLKSDRRPSQAEERPQPAPVQEVVPWNPGDDRVSTLGPAFRFPDLPGPGDGRGRSHPRSPCGESKPTDHPPAKRRAANVPACYRRRCFDQRTNGDALAEFHKRTARYYLARRRKARRWRRASGLDPVNHPPPTKPRACGRSRSTVRQFMCLACPGFLFLLAPPSRSSSVPAEGPVRPLEVFPPMRDRARLHRPRTELTEERAVRRPHTGYLPKNTT